MKHFFTITALLLTTIATAADTVKIGFARKDISPEMQDLDKGILTHGWSAAKPSKRVDMKLFVRTMAIKDSKGKILVLLTADTCKFHPVEYIDLQNWFEKKFKTGKWRLIVNASHTHQAPCWYISRGHKDPAVKAYFSRYKVIIMSACRETIEKAIADCKTPVTMKYANLQITDDMIYNKIANYGGEFAKRFSYLEKDLGVIAFFNAENGRIAGVLWSISAHPTNAFGDRANNAPYISPNIIGYTEKAIKDTFGQDVQVLFAQGVAGEMKVKYPDLKQKWNRKQRCVDSYDKESGKLIGIDRFRQSMYNYGLKIANIIKNGLSSGKFNELGNVDIKVAGKMTEARASEKINSPQKIQKTLSMLQETKSKLASPQLSDKERYQLREKRFIYNEKGERAVPVVFAKISLNKHFQILTMSGEVCSHVGKGIKDYYRQKGIKTIFFGYTPWGGYYPDNQIARYRFKNGKRLYWAKNMSCCSDDFDYEKFALDNIKDLKPQH